MGIAINLKRRYMVWKWILLISFCILKNVFVFYFKNYQAELTVLKMEPTGPPLSLSKNQHQSGGFSVRSFKRSTQTDIFFFKKLFGRLRYLRLIYVPKLRLRYLDMIFFFNSETTIFFIQKRTPCFRYLIGIVRK